MAGKRFKSNFKGSDPESRRSVPKRDAVQEPDFDDLYDKFGEAFDDTSDQSNEPNPAENDELIEMLDAALHSEEASDLSEGSTDRFQEYVEDEIDEDFYDISREAAVSSAAEAKKTKVKTKAKRSKKSIVFAILSLLLSLLFIVGGGAFVYAGNLLNSFQFVVPVLPNTSGGTNVNPSNPGAVTPEPVTGKLSPAELKESYNDPEQIDGLYHDDAIINILLLGTDDYVGDQGRSDSMMLVSIDRRHQKIKVTSFMRDMYVDLADGWAPNRLNVAYFLGGPNCLVHTIENNFHIDIDRYVLVTYEAFEKIVDALGGVEIELSDAEANEINLKSGETTATAQEGYNLLTGKQARYYARIRKIGNGDFERTSRQRSVFSSLIKKMKNASFLTLTSLANQIVPEIATDLTQEEMIALLTNALTYFNYEVLQARIPSDEMYYNKAVIISGYEAYVLIPDTEWNTIYANDFIYGDDFPELGATLDHYGYKRATGKDKI